MDFIIGLPELNGYNAILVVVNRLTKMAQYIPTREDANYEKVAYLYFDDIFHLHSLPDLIISDRGTQFTSRFSRTLCKLLGNSQNLFTSFHPQTDG